jgi:hypothetical protein
VNPWHLSDTYSLVNETFGHAQEQLVRECTRSIVDRQNFARYHYHEARRLSRYFERKHLAGRRSLFELHAADALRSAFERFIVKAGAHATACVQSVHAIPDILANAVYYSLGANLGAGAVREDKVGVGSVVRVLKRLSHDQLADLLVQSVQGADWDHLAAVANTSKHRSVVRSSFSEDWTGKRKNLRELQFEIFERGEKQYWSRSLEDTIGPEFERLSKQVIEVGHELNRCLSAPAA